jgi:hypothetical protein
MFGKPSTMSAKATRRSIILNTLAFPRLVAAGIRGIPRLSGLPTNQKLMERKFGHSRTTGLEKGWICEQRSENTVP